MDKSYDKLFESYTFHSGVTIDNRTFYGSYDNKRSF